MSEQEKTFIIYDIETFKKFFCVVFKYQGRYLTFEISERKDQEIELKAFLRKGIKNGWYFVGFNNIRFDAQVLQWILDKGHKVLQGMSGDKKAKEIHAFAQEVIIKTSMKQFPPYPEYKLDNKQIDLFLQNHYNNKARSTSLKWLEYSMNWKKVQDLPHKHDDETLGVDTFDPIIEYCINDVDATDEFFGRCGKLLELRFAQQEANPDLNVLNKSDSSIGEMLFLDMMAKKLNIPKKELKEKQTLHSSIKLAETIVPYVNFKTEEFKSVLEYFKNAEITQTNEAFKHKIMFQGIKYVYGTGGLHASWDNRVFKEDETHMILDLDVSSYYPNLSIKNKFFPKHLSLPFCELYEEKYNERQQIPKSNPQNKSLKLLLNSVYGKSGDIYSFLYDKFFQMCITVNGQLLLTMLAERLSFIEGITIIQCNTDGVTVKMPRNKKREVYNVWKWFEDLTQLKLEHAVYRKMVIRDVNNYLAVFNDGKIKLKGAFEIDVDYHKNRSQRIVPIAVRRYFVHGVPVEDTITQHLIHKKNYGKPDKGGIENQGIFDFCLGKKILSNQNYSLEEKIHVVRPEHETKEEQREFLENNDWFEHSRNKWRKHGKEYSETGGRGFTDAYRRCMAEVYPEYDIVEKIDDKVLRFFVSTNGHYLNKNYSDGRKEVTVGGNKVTKFMDYYESDDYNIDYDYYIKEAYKIIHEVDGTNEKLAEEYKLERERIKKAKQEEREEQAKIRAEEMYVKYCVNKSPTEKQFEKYGLDWLIEKHGRPQEIRPSKSKKVEA
jgi:hypothetical protein